MAHEHPLYFLIFGRVRLCWLEEDVDDGVGLHLGYIPQLRVLVDGLALVDEVDAGDGGVHRIAF